MDFTDPWVVSRNTLSRQWHLSDKENTDKEIRSAAWITILSESQGCSRHEGSEGFHLFCGIDGDVWALAVLAMWRIPWMELIMPWLRLLTPGLKQEWSECGHSPGLNPLGKCTQSLISALQHSSGKPLTPGAMATVLHKHSKFIIQAPRVLSGFVQLFDKHSVYTVMGRTKRKLSSKRRKIIWIRETHSAPDLGIRLKMGILTQLIRDLFFRQKPASGQNSQHEDSQQDLSRFGGIPSHGDSELWAGTAQHTQGEPCRHRHGKRVLDIQLLSAKTQLRGGREGTQSASSHSADISAALRLSNMSNDITVLL